MRLRRMLTAAVLSFADCLFAQSAIAISPTVSRYWPDTQNYTVDYGTAIEFSIGADDSDGDLQAAEWFLGATSKKWDPWSGRPKYYAESRWSNTFNSSGTFYVYAYVYDDAGHQSMIWWLITVNLPPLVLERSPSTLTPSCTQGQNASSQSFEVWNSGGGSMSYTINDNVAWLSVSPSSGSSSGEHDTIGVTYSTTSLSAGTYNGTITHTEASIVAPLHLNS